MKRFNAFLRSRAATTIFLLSAIAAQTPHAAYVFHATANDSHVTAWLAAFALESAVLHFVIHGQRRVSYLFASVSVAMNLAYYQMHGVNIFALQGVTAWLLSIALPVAIAFYSHSIAEQASADTKTQADASVGLPECFTVDHLDMQEPMILAVDELQELQAAIAKALADYDGPLQAQRTVTHETI